MREEAQKAKNRMLSGRAKPLSREIGQKGTDSANFIAEREKAAGCQPVGNVKLQSAKNAIMRERSENSTAEKHGFYANFGELLNLEGEMSSQRNALTLTKRVTKREKQRFAEFRRDDN